MRRPNIRRSIATKLAVPKIIGENEDDVWLFNRLYGWAWSGGVEIPAFGRLHIFVSRPNFDPVHVDRLLLGRQDNAQVKKLPFHVQRHSQFTPFAATDEKALSLAG